MAIRTKFNVSIEIDEKQFKVSVLDKISSKKQAEIKETSEKHKDSFLKRDALQSELNTATQEFEINKYILEDSKFVGKIKVALEQKSLNRDISKLNQEIKDVDENITSLQDAMEEIFEKRYDIAVSGADKAALKKEVVELGISYQVLSEEFEKLIKAEKEKK